MLNPLVITGAQAKVQNVQSDPWLGASNNFSYCYLTKFGSLLCMTSAGAMLRFTKKPRGVVQHLKQMPQQTCQQDTAARSMLEFATQSEMEYAIAEAQLSFYNSCAESAKFAILDLRKMVFSIAEKNNKNTGWHKDRYGFSHHKQDADGTMVTKTVHSFGNHDPMRLIMSLEAAAALQASFATEAGRIEVSTEGYHQGNGLVNAALLHIAQLMGPGAVVSPYNMQERLGSVTLGALELRMTERLYMDLELRRDGVVVDSRDNICAVPEHIDVNATAVFPQIMSFYPLSCAAFEMLRAQNKQKKPRKLPEKAA